MSYYYIMLGKDERNHLLMSGTDATLSDMFDLWLVGSANAEVERTG